MNKYTFITSVCTLAFCCRIGQQSIIKYKRVLIWVMYIYIFCKSIFIFTSVIIPMSDETWIKRFVIAQMVWNKMHLKHYNKLIVFNIFISYFDHAFLHNIVWLWLLSISTAEVMRYFIRSNEIQNLLRLTIDIIIV